MRELILGGQKSGKTRAALSRAAAWLDHPDRDATLIATACAHDDEMAARIARHREERALQIPRLAMREEPRNLAQAIGDLCAPRHLVVVDCLTLWLTQCAMPFGEPSPDEPHVEAAIEALVAAVAHAAGPLVLVSNEIGFGVSPLGAETRRFVDRLGTLHQRIAAVCDRVTLVVAGCELHVKGGPR